MKTPPISEKAFLFKDLAQRHQMNIFSVPINKTQHAEVLFNENAMDAYVFENKSLIGGGGFRTTDNLWYSSNLMKLFRQLNKLGADMDGLLTEYGNIILRSVKKY